MTGLLIKLIVCPLAIIVSDYLFASVNYLTIYQQIGVGLVLALSSHFMEILFLQRGSFWISNTLDFIAAFLIVYFSQYVLRGSYIEYIGAIYTSLVLTAIELVHHLYLIRSYKSEKVD
ncbi:hypothetical protein GCM10008905_29690 [Clostridium malenominatum]|uniref:DUF2512 family protein n=1 Tax=Clostridium malenominatum TaxID=1539 RepID=A0ABN1J5M0_9CLOT